jgi:hypothetical protein
LRLALLRTKRLHLFLRFRGAKRIHLFLHFRGAKRLHLFLRFRGAKRLNLFLHFRGAERLHLFLHFRGAERLHLFLRFRGAKRLHLCLCFRGKSRLLLLQNQEPFSTKFGNMLGKSYVKIKEQRKTCSKLSRTVGFEVLMAVTMKKVAFWDVTPCNVVHSYQHS